MGANVNLSDVFRFVLSLFLLPIIVRLGRGIRVERGRMAFLVGVVAITAAFGLQAFAPLTPWAQLLKLPRHFIFGFGGFSLAWSAWQMRGSELARPAGERR
jgi:uncharacterized membrane protein YqaE (UPF0057 family)